MFVDRCRSCGKKGRGGQRALPAFELSLPASVFSPHLLQLRAAFAVVDNVEVNGEGRATSGIRERQRAMYRFGFESVSPSRADTCSSEIILT